MKILAFAASLRKDSYNRKLIRIGADIAQELGAAVELVDFHAFDMPIYDGDLQSTAGLPAGALQWIKKLETADGMIISSPEYNNSIPGSLKNAIDWVSRARPIPFKGKSALLLAASPSFAGGVRGLWQLRIPLECLGVFVYPEMFPLPSADEAFDEKGNLIDPKTPERLRRLIGAYLKAAEALANLQPRHPSSAP